MGVNASIEGSNPSFSASSFASNGFPLFADSRYLDVVSFGISVDRSGGAQERTRTVSMLDHDHDGAGTPWSFRFACGPTDRLGSGPTSGSPLSDSVLGDAAGPREGRDRNRLEDRQACRRALRHRLQLASLGGGVRRVLRFASSSASGAKAQPDVAHRVVPGKRRRSQMERARSVNLVVRLGRPRTRPFGQ